MAMAMYKIRIIANACITRYNRGETDIIAIVDGYNMTEEDRNLVIAEIYSKRPDLAPKEEPAEPAEPEPTPEPTPETPATP